MDSGTFWKDLERRMSDPEFRESYHQQQGLLKALAAGCEGEHSNRTGWYAGGYHRRRWWWSPPWKVTRPWLPRYMVCPKGGDEWCNPTILIVLPLLLGDVVIRYKRGPLRHQACDTCILESGYGLCRLCGTVDCLSLLPEEE